MYTQTGRLTDATEFFCRAAIFLLWSAKIDRITNGSHCQSIQSAIFSNFCLGVMTTLPVLIYLIDIALIRHNCQSRMRARTLVDPVQIEYHVQAKLRRPT